MMGLSAHPESTLLDRVLAHLRFGPRTPSPCWLRIPEFVS
jgi:hypothetical protein